MMSLCTKYVCLGYSAHIQSSSTHNPYATPCCMIVRPVSSSLSTPRKRPPRGAPARCPSAFLKSDAGREQTRRGSSSPFSARCQESRHRPMSSVVRNNVLYLAGPYLIHHNRICRVCRTRGRDPRGAANGQQGPKDHVVPQYTVWHSHAAPTAVITS
jgi:hypothetical protein